ncbi:copper chaperone PCu(A)C [Mesorhizobium xinjiangense]|uniref:copper chaperone PCu(A)C n=1 Tax=Mesorhizobium xinjiangense TaxID=2678685 RepID=UPI0018DBFFDD|nr:copper chaperone PCu(A)C [Mesorhizobium xinjiangense]
MTEMSTTRRRPARPYRRLLELKSLFLAAALALAWAVPNFPAGALAHSYKHGSIAVGHVWAPPPEENADGIAVYGPLLNGGDTAVRLVGASSPIADAVRFRMANDGEAATWPESIDLPPNKPVSLAAWSEHIWLSGLHQPLEAGDTFDLILDFGPEGKLPVKVIVEDAGAQH